MEKGQQGEDGLIPKSSGSKGGNKGGDKGQSGLIPKSSGSNPKGTKSTSKG